MSHDIRKTMIAEVFARSWSDAAFKDRLKSDPIATLIDCGFSFSNGMKLTVLEDTEDEISIVLPAAPWVIPTHLTLSPYIEDEVPANQKAVAEMNIKAWAEPELKDRLKSDPVATLRELGIAYRDDMKIQVHENTAQKMYLAIPVRPEKVEQMSESEIAKAAEETVVGVLVSGMF